MALLKPASAPPDSSSKRTEVDGAELAVALAKTLFELGITLTASYIFSKWIAKMVAGNHAAAGPGDGFMADNGAAGSGGEGGAVARLKNLLAVRHEATVRAMTEELEEHQSAREQQQEEEKKEDAPSPGIPRNDDGGEETPEQARTARRYARLHAELRRQQARSLSALDALSPYETNIAQTNVIDPSDLRATFADVGGMDEIKSEIYDLVVLPLLRPDLFMSESGLVSPPKGILLYGPPGTGKTMLAKAIAKESHATFVNVQLSTIMNKWFGESNKLISATFQLARKLAPSVVFIDEMDAFLSQRDGTEGAAVGSMKSEFLTLWDGLLSERTSKKAASDDGVRGEGTGKAGLFGSRDSHDVNAEAENDEEDPLLPTPPVIVLGATNRPYDVDPAILRRLPRSFEIPLPGLDSRLQLLRLFLEKQGMTRAATAFLPAVAQRTEGYSGSDLKEVCRAAAWEPVREMTTGASKRAVGCAVKHNKSAASAPRRTASGFPPRGTKARPVNENDFLLALQKVKKTGESAREFHKKEFLRGREERASMAAEVARAENGTGSGKSSKNGGVGGAAGAGPGGKRISKGKTATDKVANIDIQKVMAIAMAAAASMGETTPRSQEALSFDDFGLEGTTPGAQESEDNCGVDDDEPPEILEDVAA